MIKVELWFHPKHWNWKPIYSDLSNIYRFSWLFLLVDICFEDLY